MLLTLHRWSLVVFLLSLRVLADGPVIASPDTTIVQPAVTVVDAGVPSLAGPTFNEDVAAFVADPTNIETALKLLSHAVMNGQWGLLVSFLLTALIAGLRKWVPEETKVGKWFRSKLGALSSAFGLSLGLAFVTQFGAGLPFSLAMVIKALSVAFGAVGGWAAYKNVREAIAESKAVDAGAAAVKAPDSTLDK